MAMKRTAAEALNFWFSAGLCGFAALCAVAGDRDWAACFLGFSVLCKLREQELKRERLP